MDFSDGPAAGLGPPRAHAARLRHRPAGGVAAFRRAGRSRRWRCSGAPGRARRCCSPSWCKALTAAGVETVSADYESRRSRTRRTLAVLAPTNKAASVLRGRGVPATTIHRILYTPLYHPDYEAIAEWLTGKGERPKVEGADRGGARPGARPSTGSIRRSPGRWRAPGCAARTSSRAGSGATSRSTSGCRRGLDARRAAVRGPARALPDAGAVRRPGAAGAGRRQAAAMVFDGAAGGDAADLEPGAPAGGGQPDPRPRPRAGRSGAASSRTSSGWSSGRRRATTGCVVEPAGRRRARWRGRRCWSGATRRGCG